MKNTKKLIVTLLALVLLSLNITGFAYYTGDETESDVPVKFATAVQTLYDLGIIPSNGTSGDENKVTKEDFASFVNAFGGTQVTPSEPVDDDITMGEAVKMLVEMSDNVALAEYYGEYPTGYFILGDRMGITHGLAAVQEYDKITYAMAVQMLYNAMRVTPGVVNTVTAGGKMEYEYDADCTVLSEYMELTLKQGFVTADGFWSLNPTTLPGDDGIIIDGKLFRLKNELADDYVGFEVNYYYHAEDDKICAIEKTSKADKVVLRGAYITKFSSNTYVYERNGKEKKYQLDDNVYIVSNYQANMSVNVNMWPKEADVILVDSDGNGKYETVFIKTYTEIEVQTLDVDKEKLVSKDGTVYQVPNDVPFRVYSGAKKVDASNVKQGNYATIVADSNNNVREIYISDGKVKGSVTAFSSESRYSTVEINGEEYMVSNSMANRSNLGAGVSGTFIVNFKGEISNLIIGDSQSSTSSTTTTQLGYLIKMRKVFGDDGNDLFKAKILSEKGTVETYDLIDEVKVDKRRVTGDVRALFGATDQGNGDYSSVTRQVLEFTTNADGQITKITTALPYDTQNGKISSEVQYGDHKLHVSMVGSAVYYYNNSFDNKILMDSDTVIFSVPADTTNEDDFNFTVGSGLKGQKANNVETYSYEKNNAIASAVVVKKEIQAGATGGMCGGSGGSCDTNNEHLMMVTKVTNEYSDDYAQGFDMIEYVDLYTGAVAKKLLADNAYWEVINGEWKSYDSGYGSKDLKPGDLFHMKANGLGEIGTVFKHYDASDEKLVKGKNTSDAAFCGDGVTGSSAQNFYSSSKFYLGYPVNSSSDYVAISSSPSETFANAARENLQYFKFHTTHTKVYKIKVNGNTSEYEKITLADIVPSANGDTKAVIYSSWAQLVNVIIYEK